MSRKGKQMLRWKKIRSGEYESEDKRFFVFNTWNRVYVDHWQLHDRKEPDYHKGRYFEKTLFNCKLKAEEIQNSDSVCEDKITIDEIVEALRKNDEKLHQLFTERAALVKNLTAEESHEVWSLLYSDNLPHYSF